MVPGFRALARISLEGSIDHFGELLFGSQPNVVLHHLAALEDVNRGNAHDAIVGGDIRIGVDIDLIDFGFAFVFGRKLLDRGADRLAGTAPLRPKIDKNGNLRFKNLRVELRTRNPEIRCHFYFYSVNFSVGMVYPTTHSYDRT